VIPQSAIAPYCKHIEARLDFTARPLPQPLATASVESSFDYCNSRIQGRIPVSPGTPRNRGDEDALRRPVHGELPN
jgi:hypothetical protein